jgi:hypothetical protein
MAGAITGDTDGGGNVRFAGGRGGGGATANLQALAAELHSSATQGLFEYPRKWALIAKVCGVVLIAGSVLRLLLLVKTVLEAGGRQIPIEYLGVTPWQIVGALVCVCLATALAALFVGLFPSIRITPQGLGISQLLGWRRVAWSQVGALRIMDLTKKDRYVMMIPIKGSTYPPTPAPILRLLPALAGLSKSSERGLIITSDIENFDRMVQMLISYMAQAAGQSMPHVEMFVDESAVFPLAQMVLEPQAAILRWARPKIQLDPYGIPLDQTEPQVPWSDLLRRQLLVALPPALLLLVAAILRGASPVPLLFLWGPVLVAMGVAELPFMAKVIQAVGDMMVGNGVFGRALWAYLEMQVPRAAFIMVGLALLGMGMPAGLAHICWLTGIFITTCFTLLFVQRTYYIAPAQALIAGMGCFFYQLVLLAFYFGVS